MFIHKLMCLNSYMKYLLAAFSTADRMIQTSVSKYSLNTANYPALPLYMYDPDYPVQHMSLLNKVFWKVFQVKFEICLQWRRGRQWLCFWGR